jgi:hypothetical protein
MLVPLPSCLFIFLLGARRIWNRPLPLIQVPVAVISLLFLSFIGRAFLGLTSSFTMTATTKRAQVPDPRSQVPIVLPRGQLVEYKSDTLSPLGIVEPRSRRY